MHVKHAEERMMMNIKSINAAIAIAVALVRNR